MVKECVEVGPKAAHMEEVDRFLAQLGEYSVVVQTDTGP